MKEGVTLKLSWRGYSPGVVYIITASRHFFGGADGWNSCTFLLTGDHVGFIEFQRALARDIEWFDSHGIPGDLSCAWRKGRG